MLGKLLKYDAKNLFKFLVIFYILALFFSVLTRIFLSIENSLVMNIIGKICSGVTISMMFNILINNLMRMWVRFKHNLYGDESYLTHTLPVKKHTLYLSKSITAVITLFVSVGIIGATLFIAYYSKENVESLKNMLLPLADAYGSTVIKMIVGFLFIFFLEFANGLQAGYTGIILGHRINYGKTVFSVLFGFITYIITQIFALICMFICALFNTDIMNLFYTTEMLNIDSIKMIIYLVMGIYTLILLLLYILNIKLFSKGVNIE